jgi:hypothetical protein
MGALCFTTHGISARNMAAPAPLLEAKLVTPTQLGYVDPTDSQIVATINQMLSSAFDGQRLIIERKPQGNLGYALRKTCGVGKVIVPDAGRLADLLRATVGDAWIVYIKRDTFVFELFPRPARDHRAAVLL